MYATNEGGRIELVDLKSDNTTDLVVLSDIRDVSTTSYLSTFTENE